jgi:hypothetical protein
MFQFVFIVGVTIMVLCTYTTLNSQDHVKPKPIAVEKPTVPQKVDSKPLDKAGKDSADINIKKSKDEKGTNKRYTVIVIHVDEYSTICTRYISIFM